MSDREPASAGQPAAIDPQSLATLRALLDVTRLRIAGLLVGQHMRLDQLTAALGTTPGALVRQLDLLRQAGLLETRTAPGGDLFGLRVRPLSDAARALAVLAGEAHRAPGGPGGPDIVSYPPAEAAVLHAFLVEGRLRSIPTQERKRLVVLRYLACTVFPEDREYPEKEVNQLLALRHPDVAALRRYLVDHGFMRRERGMYRLQPDEAWPAREA